MSTEAYLYINAPITSLPRAYSLLAQDVVSGLSTSYSETPGFLFPGNVPYRVIADLDCDKKPETMLANVADHRKALLKVKAALFDALRELNPVRLWFFFIKTIFSFFVFVCAPFLCFSHFFFG